MVGGALQPELAGLSTADLKDAVLPDLRRLLGVVGYPVFTRHNVWPQAIPQYELGYERFLETMADCERAHPGLFIGGQARNGVALGSCIATGEKLAASALRFAKSGCV
jgi:oxygen-dependent protoporphyrinogen oxidase